MIIEIVVALILSPVLYCLIEYIEHLLKLKNFPNGPFPLPIIGNLHLLSTKPYEDLKNMADIYGDVFSISLGMNRTVIVSSIERAKEALVTKDPQFAGRPQDIYTASLISRGYQNIGYADYGPYWKMLRKLTHSALKIYGEGMQKIAKIIVIESEELRDILKTYDGQAVDPKLEIGNSVLNIICQITFGHRYRRNDPEFKDVINFQTLIFKGLAASDIVGYIPWLRVFPLKGITSLKKGIAIRDPIFQKKLQEHKKKLDHEKSNDFTDEIIKLSQDKTFLQKIEMKTITDSTLEMCVNDLFIAGTETTTTTIQWLLVRILHQPQIQDKIYEELINKIGYDRYPELSDREDLPYLNACLQEVLRISVIAPFGVPRKTIETTNLNGTHIPKGTQIFVNFWSIQRNEKYWKNPDEFNPHRWFDENGKIVDPSSKRSYIPFSAGIRGCPGKTLAELELFLFVSRLFRDFQVEPVKGEKLPSLDGEFGLTLCPKPFKVVFKPRTK